MPLFITIDGVDKTGKTTQISNIEKRLTDLAYNVVVVREPGTTKYGEAIRKVVKNGFAPTNQLAQYLLFSSVRAELVASTIIPALQRKSGLVVVICDRYTDSSWAYNGQELPDSVKRDIDKQATYGVQPDLTFLFDISYEEYLKRGKVGELEPDNKQDYLRLQSEYFRINQLNPQRCVWLNCDGKSSTEITNILMKELAFKLQAKKMMTEQLTEFIKSI